MTRLVIKFLISAYTYISTSFACPFLGAAIFLVESTQDSRAEEKEKGEIVGKVNNRRHLLERALKD